MATTARMKEQYFRRQALYWVILAAAVLVAWFVLWLASSSPVIIKKDDAKPTQKTTELPTRIESLGELNAVVSPIDFSTLIRDLRTYPIEFKDKRYFDGKKFTVQIMDVSQNDVVVNYLNARDDREKFAYFRYLDDNQNPRYVVTYGKFDSMEQANATLQATNFDLPKSVTPFAVSMKDYLSIIDDYERSETVRDSSGRQPRQVRLQATRTEIPVQAATAADEALATKSQAQAQERAAQLQNTADDDAQHTPVETDTPVIERGDVKPKSEKPKSESDAVPQKAEEPAVKEKEAVATPTVNTPKVPGSE